ncbi:MAG: peptide chain release factor 1 [Candidatus Komeilibacteria bacterium]
MDKKLLTEYQTKIKKLEADLQNPDNVNDSAKLAELSQEYGRSKEISAALSTYFEKQAAQSDLEKQVNSEPDEEMKAMINDELEKLHKELPRLAAEINQMLIPSDPMDKKNAIIEIRAGTGGDESALFAADLWRMYSRYAEKHSWKTHIVAANRTELNGYKEIIVEIIGNGAYGRLKYESGVHRVQRVPETEKSGRIHTSAATVAVLPEAEEIDIEINPKDLRIDTFCAGGHGGQSVNTTYSAIRITHLPTNIVVSCQDERSQQQNKLKAMQVLRSRLLKKIEDDKHQAEAASRKSQVGSGDRSEKIRTYNWPQDRVTDHRIKLTVHNLNNILDGNLDEIIDALYQADHASDNN